MKKIMFVILATLTCLGCSNMAKDGVSFKEYFTQPRNFIQDPHFAEYKEKRDQIESMYLDGSIDYVEYTERMEMLENKYTADVQERDHIIHD